MERLTSKQAHILSQKLCDMKNRCYNPSHKFYKDYGARGITVCDEWSGKDGHKNFQKWALENGWHEGCSIDRIDVNGSYEPSNCRWASAKEQANNRRNNKPITIKGVTKNATEWAEEIGISERAFMSRIEYGWDEDRLLEPKFKPLKMTKAEMAREIREWRRAEEQGLLLRLPCKAGSVVYKICPQSKYIEFGQMWDGKVVEHPCQRCPWKCCDCKDIGYQKDMNNIIQDVVAMNELWIVARKMYFGTIYFLTKEEAEQALAEMQKG